MSYDRGPLVSIGIPVYNGDNFLKVALDSLLNQTYSNFEIIICDNASDDNTENICREYAARDSRIRYFRNNANIGAAPNFNLTVELAKGDLFKWAAHDDICTADYLSRCVSVLQEDDGVVWAHTRSVDIDEDGNVVKKRHWNVDLHSWLPYRRFADAILVNHECLCVFGVIRMEVLKQTDMIGSFVASDRVLLAQLSLFGRYHEVAIDAFQHREHVNRSTKSHASLSDRQKWFDPKIKAVSPNRKLFLEYLKSIQQKPMPRRHKALCYWHLFRWLVRGGQSF